LIEGGVVSLCAQIEDNEGCDTRELKMETRVEVEIEPSGIEPTEVGGLSPPVVLE